MFDAWTVFTTTNPLDDAEALVQLAELAGQKGARIVLDNCDNQFANVTESVEWRNGLERLRRLGQAADVFVSCSNALSDAMQSHISSAAQHVVIDDPIEEQITYPDDMFLKSLFSVKQKVAWLRALKHGIALANDKLAGRALLVWFGSHGNQFSPGGMNDILPLRPILEQVAESHPISLTVISNHRKKFEANFLGWNFPTHYLEWDRVTFLHALKAHEISIIPSMENAFTRCKSSNRLTLSIHHGLSVVADPVPSYLAFKDAVRIGNWESNLRQLLASPTQRHADLLSAQAMVRSRVGLSQIAMQWSRALFPGALAN